MQVVNGESPFASQCSNTWALVEWDLPGFCHSPRVSSENFRLHFNSTNTISGGWVLRWTFESIRKRYWAKPRELANSRYPTSSIPTINNFRKAKVVKHDQ